MSSYETRKNRSQTERKCIGFSEALEQQREKKAARGGPQPWIIQKLTIGIVVCLVGYTVYVYVVRFCVPMIRKEARSMGGRAMGIGFLVAFSLLFLMFSWAYLKVIITSPGYAKDYVHKTPAPAPQPQPPYHNGAWNSDESIAGTPYDAMSLSRSRSGPSLELPSIASPQDSPRTRSPAQSRRNIHDTTTNMAQVRPSQRTDGGEAGPLDAALPPSLSRPPKLAPQRPPAVQNNDSGLGLPPPLYSRRPPTHPALSPEYRYCSRDGFVKPMRAHHCRACGTCVLKYDHHCPWIGQCVGAFNHKFFVNFLQWSTIFTTFVFASLIGLNARASSPNSISTSIDPQEIVIIALSGIFTIFTLTLFLSHVHLISLNASTVEHLGMQRMRERESGLLSQMTTCPCPGFSDPQLSELSGHAKYGDGLPCIARRRILKQWDEEWGKISTEGNIWWLGGKRANWEATMGKSKWGWILPIGRSIGDGLTYPTNPRFDRDGRWRRRAEWPEGLR